MRVALLASTFALCLASPAAAQCVYVACGGSVPNPPTQTYQAPQTQPLEQFRSYEDGYAAGLAARTTTHTRTRAVRQTSRTAAKRSTTQRHVTRRPTTTAARSTPVVRRHVAATATRSVQSRPQATRQHVVRRTPVRMHATTHAHTATFRDTIKDRASTYRATAIGSSTLLASHMQQSSGYVVSSSTRFIGPAQVVNQGGQMCGWGTRIVTTQTGQSSQQSAWLCQCPQGWRPPGY
jgi:hypothetical protein